MGSMECTGEFDVAYLEKREGKPSTGFYVYSFLLWEQLLKVGKGLVRVKNGMTCLFEKESTVPQCLTHSFKAAWRLGT